MSETPSFEGWAILELMGHRKLAGYVREENVAGAAFVRIDVPASVGHGEVTQMYSPGAIYCITPTTEEIARAVAPKFRPAPVHQWELAALPGPNGDDDSGDDDI